MKNVEISERTLYPLAFQIRNDADILGMVKARDLEFDLCPKPYAVNLVSAWHSRLPKCARGPWTQAFHAHCFGVTYAVALWNNPSTRCLPPHWRELRRMACAPDAPRNTPSRFISFMVKWFERNAPESEKLISYQDCSVHSGTIYKASGWFAEYRSEQRIRDRSIMLPGHRYAINGVDADMSAKVRWSKVLKTKPSCVDGKKHERDA